MKEKLLSLTTIEGIKSGLQSLKQYINNSVSNLRQGGVTGVLSRLQDRINKLFSRQSQNPQQKQESKYWQVAFGQSKQEVLQKAHEHVRNYMVNAHWNIDAVMGSL